MNSTFQLFYSEQGIDTVRMLFFFILGILMLFYSFRNKFLIIVALGWLLFGSGLLLDLLLESEEKSLLYSFNQGTLVYIIPPLALINYWLIASFVPRLRKWKGTLMIFVLPTAIAYSTLFFHFEHWSFNTFSELLAAPFSIDVLICWGLTLLVVFEHLMLIGVVFQLRPLVKTYLEEFYSEEELKGQQHHYHLFITVVIMVICYVTYFFYPLPIIFLLRSSFAIYLIISLTTISLKSDVSLLTSIHWTWTKGWVLSYTFGKNSPQGEEYETEQLEQTVSEERLQQLMQHSNEWIVENNRFLVNVRMADLNAYLNVKRFEMRELFRFGFKSNFRSWLNSKQINFAKILMLNQSELSIKEVAHASGYVETSSFTRTFKVVEGISPTEWQRANKDIP